MDNEPNHLLPPNRPDEASFLVMTHNCGNGLATPERLTKLVRDSGADLIGLEELKRPHAEALEKLADVYPYRYHQGDGTPGKGIYSKFPLRDVESLDLYPERADLRAVVEVQGRDLLLLVAHPSPRRFRRWGYYMDVDTKRQIRALVKMAMTAKVPSILLGDFNLTPNADDLIRYTMAAGLVDAFRVAGHGRGYTLPACIGKLTFTPFLRVDFIWTTPHMLALKAWVGGRTGSDHLPIFARLKWKSDG